MTWRLRPRGAALGSVLALAVGIVGPSALPSSEGALGPPRPELVAAELLAGPADERVEAIVVLADQPAPAQLRRGPAAAVNALRTAAERSQPTLVEHVAGHGGEVLSRLWIQNAVVVRGVPATLLAASGVKDVDRIIPNFRVTAPDLTARTTAVASPTAVDGEHTWGIDRINAHRVWDELGLDGSGVRVATLDTGVDPEHPDLAGKLVSDDPGDPSYPGGWIAFGGDGRPLPLPPVDTHGHGTHVSGTIHGGDSTGVAIGVAPAAEMMHAMVLPGGFGDFANVLAGMQWAAAPYDQHGNPAGRPADVVTMSFGEVGIVEEYIAPIRNLVAAGIVPVVAIGNDCGFGNTASPGNVYESLAVGATDPADDVASFSCGGTIGRDQWSQPPPEWPESYVKPDLSAPGVDVYSAVPGGSHTHLSGTSMAAPHVAGAVALMRQADPDLTVEQLRDTLAVTAFFDDRHGVERPNPRYGHGRIDALAAVTAVLPDSGVDGTVTDAATGSPVAGVTVTVDGVGRAVTSGPDGSYRLHLEPAAYDLHASRFGYQPASVAGVTVAPGTFTRVDVALTAQPTGTVSGLVRYEPSGRGVPGARVEVVDHEVGTTSDADGGFTLSLPEGTYLLRAAAPPLRDSRPVEVTVAGGAVTEVVLDLRHPGRTQRVDVATDGTPANTASASPSISADGRFVAFQTAASNLVPGDTNGRADIYVRDLLTGVTERVSVASDGTQSDGDSHRPAISADGRFVAFDSTASNLVDDPAATGIQSYVHDRVTGVTELVSQSTGGKPANDWSRDSVISGDGRYVLFGSQATNLVPGAAPGHIYLRDRVEQTTVIASVASGGTPANTTSLGAGISDDGTQVSFYSASTNLDANIRNGVFNVFVHDRTTGQTRRVSLSTDGQESQGGANTQSVISGNGRVVAWDSRAHNLVADDTNNAYDVFVHDRDTGGTTRVSLSSGGDQGDRNSRHPALSGDGRYVAFDSPAENLVEGDTNGVFDVFVHDRRTGQTVRESVAIDGGQADGHSTQQVLDGQGRFVAFHSVATNLLDGPSAPGGVYVRDRFGPDGPAPQFVAWNLQVDSAVALSPGPVTVSATVTNVGDGDGTYPATLRIDGRPVATEPVALAPGQSRNVQWTVERAELGTYLVQLGPATASFRIRAPEVDLSVSSLQGAGHAAGPLADASVALFDGQTLVPVGATDADGRLRFETTAPQGTYNIVVRRLPTADDDLAYLLVRPVTVEGDVTVDLAPHTFHAPPAAVTAPDPAALVDVDLHAVTDRHQAWVYLRHPATGGYGFAFPPGPVVASVAPAGTAFEAVDVHAVVGLERDWWAVSQVIGDLSWNDPVGYGYRLGGPATATLAARVLEGTEVEATWTLHDAAGHEIAEFRRTALRPFATSTGVPPVRELDQVAAMVAERAPQPAEVILRLDDPQAAPVHAGGVDWAQRRLVLDLADLTDEVPGGTYRLRLEAATGTYSGPVSATTTLEVAAPPLPEQFLLVLSGEPDRQLSGGVEDVVRALKDTAEQTQRELIARIEAGELGDARVVNRFWLQNMLLVEVGSRAGMAGTDGDVRGTLASVPGVVRVVPNFDVTVVEPTEGAGTWSVVEDRAWGVDRIGAHLVHRELALDGTGVRVATLDTGVDTAHPDLAGRMVNDRPGDPAHPGGWIEFDPAGHPVASTPHDTAEHGTHVSGTIHGGNASGVQIGVAPGADLMHALALPAGRGTFAQVVAGMQWALDPFDATGAPAGRPADVINMSLGAPGLHQEMVTPIGNLRRAGVFPAISIGNDCAPGGTSSPGNVYEAVGVGATDAGDSVADFSCGGRVSSDDWPSPPPDWPATYVKPDLTAPGVGVYSSLPGGGYGLFSGTSMAAPHVAGTAALLLQADPDASVDDLVEHLAATAFYDGRHGPERPNPRFGHGRIDAYAAALRVAVDSGVSGMVRDAATGAPVAGATVESLTNGARVTTGEDGGFRLRLKPGVHSLSVTAFGYEPAVVDEVEVAPDTFASVDIGLDRTPWGSLEGTVVVSGSGRGVPGVEVALTGTPLRVQTGADGGFTIPAVPVGEYQLLAAPHGLSAPPAVTVTVEEGATTTVEVQVEPPPMTVGLLGDRNGSIGRFLDEHGIASETVDWQGDVSRYGAIVVNQPGDPGREAFLDFLAATDAAGVGVVFHDTWSSLGNGIELLSRHTGNPAVRGRGFSGAIDFLYYQVTAAHPVVAGFDVGDRVFLNSRTSTREHAWFDGYEGDGRLVVADAARNDLGIVGRGIGVQQRENNRHVLLSMHATGSIIRTDDWGPDGEQVFLHALEWVTPEREDGFPVMVPWGITVDPDQVLGAEPVQVSVNVTNVGTGPGEYEAVLTVDGEVAQTTVVTLDDGATTTVTWSLTREQLGTYQVAVAGLSASFRVRAPRVDLSVSTLARADHDGAPMSGAIVELIDQERRIPLGTTGDEGTLSFETTRAAGDYTVVVRRPATGGHDLAYLLVRQLRVDADTAMRVAPRTQAVGHSSGGTDGDPAAVVRLHADPVADGDRAWTFLRHPLAVPHAFAFPPGPVVTTVADEPFQTVHVHAVAGLERDWWAVSQIVDDLRWTAPVGYDHRFGGQATPRLVAERLDGTRFRVTWSVTDAYGHHFRQLTSTRLRSFDTVDVSVPDALPLEQVVEVVASRAPVAAEVVLRMSGPDGAPVHAGGVGWDQPSLVRDLADLVPEVADGVYPLALELEAGAFGRLSVGDDLIVDTTGPVLDWLAPAHRQGFLDPEITVAGTVTDATSGASQVLVNGDPALLDAAGGWQLPLSLGPGENLITVTAVDHHGNRTTETRTVALLGHSATWQVPSGSPVDVLVQLRIFDPEGRATFVGPVDLVATGSGGETYGPFELDWRGQHYQYLLRDLPPDEYQLTAVMEVDGWHVELAGPRLGVPDRGRGADGDRGADGGRTLCCEGEVVR